MPSFKKDPCGYFCIAITYCCLAYADYVIVKWVVLHTIEDSIWAVIHVLLFNALLFMLSCSHIRAICSDPGIVPLPQTRLDFSDIHSACSKPLIENEEWTVCTRCETYRPPRAHHCRICERCIRKMDHHCPWINNCVGELNQRFFIQFLTYVTLVVLYSIGLVIFSWIKDCPNCSRDVETVQLRTFHSIVLCLKGVMFGLFVGFVLYDQLETVSNDDAIYDYRLEAHKKLSCHKQLFSQVCKTPRFRGYMKKSYAHDSHTV